MVHHDTAVHHAEKASTPIGMIHKRFASTSPMAMLSSSFKVPKMDAYKPGHDVAHAKHAGRKVKKKHMVSFAFGQAGARLPIALSLDSFGLTHDPPLIASTQHDQYFGTRGGFSADGDRGAFQKKDSLEKSRAKRLKRKTKRRKAMTVSRKKFSLEMMTKSS